MSKVWEASAGDVDEGERDGEESDGDIGRTRSGYHGGRRQESVKELGRHFKSSAARARSLSRQDHP